ncbi:hypothetical protein OPT61_g4046 [Boeremia exigua]|uniref:Uncharacterized protein n=1 Tax=Boeremia exigua TaxID=749465 RepID=A0ACC2IFJ0_9PLEO|nr:hypothetical protein OPT61_g4046 [Boeremia exigua]
MALPRLLPRPPKQSPRAPDSPQSDKRRRGMNHTACNQCRAKREKCSGQRPSCHSCERHSRECVYAAPEGVTRQQANKQRLAEVERLSSYLRDVVDLLRQGSEADAAAALRRIRQAEQVEEAINALAVAQALVAPPPTIENFSGSSSRPEEISSPSLGPHWAFEYSRSSSTEQSEYIFHQGHVQTRDQYNEDDTFIELSALNLSISRWTSACKDDRLMNHLFALFWSWDNMVEPSLFRPMFEEGLSNNITTFCSPFLVNALLALSCLLTTKDVTSSNPEDRAIRGRKFAEEAERHFEKEKSQPSIPLLQGQFAMFAYKGNVDGGTNSIDYFMGAIETYEALNKIDFLESLSSGNSESRMQEEHVGLSWVMWGFYCTEWRVSQAFGFQKPAAKPLIAKLWRNDTFALCQPDSPSYWWTPYPETKRIQRSMKVEIREANASLSEMAEDILDYLYPLSDCLARPPVANPQRAIELYNTLVQWKLTLPARLRLEEAILPSAILLHSYVELLLGDLLRPFSAFKTSQFGPFDPKERCYTHCISLMNTIWTFRAYTSLNEEYWYIPMLATVAFMTFREHTESPILTETLIKACKCLHEMTSVYPMAADALNAIRGAFKRKGMPVPTYLQASLGSGLAHMKDGLLHHAAAKLMPEVDLQSDARDEVRYQELLDELDDVEIQES